MGYQAVNTLGRSLLEGADNVKLFGESIEVQAEICQLTGLSGHADREGLLKWVNSFEPKPKRVFIVHGNDEVEDIFAHPATDAARRLVYPGGVSAKQYPAGTRAVRVSFNGGTVYDPLIASLAIDCGVKVTILGADTRTIDGKAFGTMLLLLPDDPNEAAKALSYIRSQPNITAEEVEYHA